MNNYEGILRSVEGHKRIFQALNNKSEIGFERAIVEHL